VRNLWNNSSHSVLVIINLKPWSLHALRISDTKSSYITSKYPRFWRRTLRREKKRWPLKTMPGMASIILLWNNMITGLVSFLNAFMALKKLYKFSCCMQTFCLDVTQLSRSGWFIIAVRCQFVKSLVIAPRAMSYKVASSRYLWFASTFIVW